jgi:hypothetical protein
VEASDVTAGVAADWVGFGLVTCGCLSSVDVVLEAAGVSMEG